ncbi:MAG: hypothetical protein ABIB71_06470 [Candidatus Woesearchaeota archaeon]
MINIEKTINDGKDKTAYQLKKLLGNREKQDLGNVERWKQIPVEYIVTANTLGVELNDHALKRLNEAKDKEHAFESIYVTQYFAKEARKLKKDDLAEKLEAMVEDESLATEEIAFYATKAIENELPKDKVLEKLAKAFYTKETSLNRKKKEGLEEAVNSLDIVLVPIDKEGYCKAYASYDINSNKRKDWKNIAVNVYSLGNRKPEALRGLLKRPAQNRLDQAARVEVIHRNWGDGLGNYTKIGYYLGGHLGLGTVSFGIGSGLGAVGAAIHNAVSSSISEAPYFPWCIGGGALALAIWEAAITYGPISRLLEKHRIKQSSKDIENYDVLKINWIESQDIKNLWAAAFKGKKAEPFKENDVVQEASRRVTLHGAGLTTIGTSEELKEAYRAMAKETDAYNKQKEEERQKSRKKEERETKLIKFNVEE